MSNLLYSENLFVVREAERRLFAELVDSVMGGGHSNERTLIFTGERGIGKSWLLHHLQDDILQTYKPDRVERIKIFDFNLEAYKQEQPDDDVMDILRRFREKIIGRKGNFGGTLKEMSRMVLEEWQATRANLILIILADSVYESRWELLEELENYFLGPLAIEPRTVIVMTGRGRAYPFRTPELGTHAQIQKLEPFNLHQTAEQLTRLRKEPGKTGEISEVDIQQLYDYSRGNPLVNRLLADHDDPADALDEAINDVLSIVETDRREKLRIYLEALCVLRAFKEERITEMLKVYDPQGEYKYWNYSDERDARDLMTRYAFAQWNEERNGYVISASLRELIERYLKKNNFELWIKLHCKARALYSYWADHYVRARTFWQAEADYHAEQLTQARVNPEQACAETTKEFQESRQTPAQAG